MPSKMLIHRFGLTLGRSLFPITALVVVLGVLVWGPWISFGLAYVWWRIVARIG